MARTTQVAPEAASNPAPNCPACSGQQFQEKRLLPEISVRRCIGCGLLLSDIQQVGLVRAEFSRINEDAYHKSVGILRQQQAREVLSFIREHKAGAGAWLDIGCSFGHLLQEAKRNGYQVLGVEPDDKAFRHAQSLVGEAHVYHGLMTDETCPDRSVDIISMMDVLEHIPAAALPDFATMIRHKLRPGGMWVIKVPATEGAYFILAHRLLKIASSFMSGMIKRLWQSEYEFPHTVYFNRETLRLFLENHGFKLVAHRYMDELPNNTIIERLLMDNTIPAWQAYLISPAFYLINVIEKWRGRSDALLILARPEQT